MQSRNSFSRLMPRPRSASPEANYQVRALQRGLAILASFSHQQASLSLAEVSGRLSIPKPTTLRLLECLRGEGFATYDPISARYSLGPRAFEVGSAYLGASALEQHGPPFLRRLARDTGQTANLGILDGFTVLHVSVAEPDRPLRYHTRAGEHDALHCTGLGKVLIAQWTAERLHELASEVGLARRTPSTVTELSDLEAELARVRQCGYAEDGEEGAVGLRCLAAPVRDARGDVIAAMSISGAAAEFNGHHRAELLRLLFEQSRGLSRRLGWTDPIGVTEGGMS
jgi:DNA-binding IclR family transcriptional regulator